MTSRILPPHEWSKLVGTEADQLWPHLDPVRTTVLVVEDGDVIVGTWLLMEIVHAECLWIAPAYRGKASVARRLWTTMQRTAQAMGLHVVVTAAIADDIRDLLDHVGAAKVPGDHYAMKVH